MDLVAQIMAFEDGELHINDTIQLFAHLLRTGIIYQLQGSYGRLAQQLINAGYLDRNGNVLKLEEVPA